MLGIGGEQIADTPTVTDKSKAEKAEEKAQMPKVVLWYLSLQKCLTKVKKNGLIHDKERQIENLEHLISEAKGIFCWKLEKIYRGRWYALSEFISIGRNGLLDW